MLQDLLARTVGGMLSRASRPRPPANARERAEWDARTLVRLMDREQLRRYAETTDEAVDLIAAERLRTWRSRDELRPTPEEREVLSRPWRWARQGEVVLAGLRVVLLLFGWAFLITGIIGILGVGPMIWVSAASLLVATLALTAHSLVIGVIDRLRVRPLLEWASHIPGQLGRGLPGSMPTSTVSGAMDLVVFSLTVILVGAGIGGIVIAVLVTAIELIFWALEGLAPSDLGFSAGMAGGGLALVALAWGIAALWGAMVQADRRRISAVQWIVED
ncbi:hypothetical protein [Ornithinimicrobium panacihumi]|uniref:hypothetical protein n=1 Tax=Ornithinimicrobium panacihumi TaxID=2008449 RepID=UPI003F8B2FFC